MAEATFVQGNPACMDYTPSGAIASGQVVVLGDLVTVAHRAIAASTLGSVSVGGGIYDVTAELAIAIGETVYWDDTNNKVDKTNTNKKFGYAVSASAADGDTIRVVHWP